MRRRDRQGRFRARRFRGAVASSGAARLAAVVLLALQGALSACALSDPPSYAKILTGALPEETRIPPEWIAGGSPEAVGTDWLRSFDDPGLEAVVAEAIANNPDLRQAAARVEAARQTAVLVGARLKPQLGIDLGVASTHDDDHHGWYDSSKALAGAAWEPDIWGKLRAEREAAEEGYEATAFDYAYARQSLAATVARTWYLNVETVQLLAYTRQTSVTYADLLALVKVRRDAGKVADLDVAEASANYNAAESAVLAAEAAAREARRSLEVLLGRYPAAELEVARTFPVEVPPVRAGLPSELLERRPDMVAAERMVVAAFRKEETAELALLPSFSLNLDGGRLADNLLSVLQVNPWMVSAAIGMYVPVYLGGALEARIEIATADQQEAVAQYGSAALTAFREVENGLMNEALLAGRLQFEENVLRDRTEAVRIAQLKYDAGRIALLSLLQLQAAQIASQVEVIKLHNARLANRIDLHLALGGSFDAAPAAALP